MGLDRVDTVNIVDKAVTLPKLGDDVTALLGAGGFPYTDDSYVIVERGATDVANAAALRTAYTAAKALTPGGNALSATNRAAVLLVPGGRYDLGTGDGSNHGLQVDAQFVDLIGLTGVKEEVVLTSQIATASRGTLEQTADDVIIKGITLDINQSTYTLAYDSTDPAAYFPSTNLPNAKLVDVKYTSQSESNARSMRTSIEYSGTYTDCVGGDWSFGSRGTASGTFTRCTGGDQSFGGNVGTASGTFTDCVGGDQSFSNYSASGTFTRCVGGDQSFGNMGTVSGTFTDCVGGDWSFDGSSPSGTAAIMRRCRSVGRSDAIKNWQGLMIDCEIEVTGTNKHAVELATGATPELISCKLTANGTGSAVYAASVMNARITDLTSDFPIHTNITNTATSTFGKVRADNDQVGSGTKHDGFITTNIAEVQTTDATQTTLDSLTLLDENTYHVEAYVVGVQSDGTDRASYHIACTVYRTAAGGATLQGTVTSVHTQESNPAVDVTFTVSGDDLRVSVTGVGNWQWGSTLKYMNMSN